MRACKNCGLSMGDTATFCAVCGTLADPGDAASAPAPVARSAETSPVASAAEPASVAQAAGDVAVGPGTAAGLEAEARRCEKTDPARAATLYRRAVVAHLESGEDPLGSHAARRDVQRLFDRLSLVLKRRGLVHEALEEIDAAAFLGLVDDEDCGTKAQRRALAKRRDALRRAAAKAAHD